MKIELQKSFNTLLIIIALGVLYYFLYPHLPGLMRPAVLIMFILIGLMSLMTVFNREYDDDNNKK